MTTIGEAAATAKTPLASSLAAGVNNISYNQTITFTLYQKKILPADGFVFWINGNLITPTPIDSATVNIQGSLHYSTEVGQHEDATVSSVMETQIIDTQADLDALEPIVSNSLPIWLAMPSYVPPYPGFTCPIPLYPSFLVPDNEPPPYGAVHIEDTRSLVDAASFGPTL